jgi:hypothetical protein
MLDKSFHLASKGLRSVRLESEQLFAAGIIVAQYEYLHAMLYNHFADFHFFGVVRPLSSFLRTTLLAVDESSSDAVYALLLLTRFMRLLLPT